MLLQEKKRYDYIDWAKAISIILIVLGHMLPSGCWPKVLAYSFHVPIFAIIGGVLFSAPKTWRDFGKKCLGFTRRLIIPYIIWFTVFCSFYWMNPETMPSIAVKSATKDFGELIKYFFFYERSTVWNAAMWFMPCYIIISFLFLLFTRISKGNRIASLCLSISSFATVVILEKKEITIDIGEIKNVFGLKNYFLMLGFLALGFALRPLFDKCAEFTENPRKNPISYAAIGMFVMVAIICLKCNTAEITKKRPAGYYTLSMYSGLYNDLVQFIIFAILLSVSLMLVLMLLPKCKPIQLFSRNSLFIMFSHYLFFTHDSFLSMAKESWKIDMAIGFRDTAYIMLIYLAILWACDALFKKYPKTRPFFSLIGIQ